MSESTGLVNLNGRFYKDLKVVELKQQLRNRWQPTGGLKGVLQARLLRALRKEADVVRYCNATYDWSGPSRCSRFYKDLKVIELKQQLRERWLPTGGRKSVLQARLLRALHKEYDAPPSTIYNCIGGF